MRKAFAQIEKILDKSDSGIDPALAMTLHLAKHTEEAGEMAQSINKLNGRKKMKKNETRDDVLKNIVEEAADSIQCLIAIAIQAGADYETLKATLVEKNNKFEENVNEK
jgi:NTP pyrophosphatase (non-canonical NTP hydrolase)